MYCIDCKRRRRRRKNSKEGTRKIKTQDKKFRSTETMKKINSTKILRSQSTILGSALKSKSDEEESDFKLNESDYSGASFDSVYSWTYGKPFSIIL